VVPNRAETAVYKVTNVDIVNNAVSMSRDAGQMIQQHASCKISRQSARNPMRKESAQRLVVVLLVVQELHDAIPMEISGCWCRWKGCIHSNVHAPGKRRLVAAMIRLFFCSMVC
jgi:hypothetical protein